MKRHPLLGVLGGLGPMSTFYFCELLTAHTKARTDADHIDMLISSRASTPDRTAYILGQAGARDPLPVMREEAHRLAAAGAELLVIPCNTAHYFYDGLAKDCPIPILNIIRQTVAFLQMRGIRRCGLLATEGTVASGAYARLFAEAGIECLCPDPQEQAVVTGIIYGAVKQNLPPDFAAFLRVSQALLNRGCECLVLGCTELSLLRREGLRQPWFVDSLEVLTCSTILACGKEPTGFPPEFDCLREVTV